MARRTAIFHDWGKTSKKFSYAILGAGKKLTSEAMRDLGFVAQEFLSEQDAKWPHNSSGAHGSQFGGDRLHPWYSGQLHDSVAVRIAQGNRTMSAHYMPSSAYPPEGEPGRFLTSYCAQTMKGVSDDIVGVEWAHEAVESKMPYYFLPGLQVQLVVGVPYADLVNEDGRHFGFFDALADDLTEKVDKWIASGGLTSINLVADEKGVRVQKRRKVRYD